ncbi:unnamed protein product [Caenorhabditis angaria]|uniref:Uncharacterized protein n=1 Tax=Caenorhabditis angaria TaxID=860376 RepID=A0A9P1IWT1_9PELO|nr:unnamed protein product [Caenorhabditis angaria]
MLDALIILLAVQRAVIIFLDEKWHFLVGLFSSDGDILRNNPVLNQYYHFTISLSVFTSFICTILYISLFYHLFKQRGDVNFWQVPEIAFLYEGVPILITRVFISFYSFAPLSIYVEEDHYVDLFNYEIRYRVISTALVQFTYIFDIESIRRFFQERKRKTNQVDLSPTTQVQL